MKSLRIGYAPNSRDLKHPADRRRLVYWAQKRNYEIVFDQESKVDVFVMSGRANFPDLIKKMKRTPVIIDLVDGYLGHESFAKDWIRGVAKVSTKQISGRPRNFRKIVANACQQADAVICESVEQALTIAPFSRNVHPILDFHDEFPFIPFNQNTKLELETRMMWEGLPYTISGLQQLEVPLRELRSSHNLSLEVVTDTRYASFLGHYFDRNTINLLGAIPKIFGTNFRLSEWSIDTVIEVTKRSHISLLPLNPAGKLNPLKAENRLLMMWRMGLPVLASPNLAYLRVMNQIGIDGICETPYDWFTKIEDLLSSKSTRKDHVERGQEYIRTFHAEHQVLKSWDNLIESVL